MVGSGIDSAGISLENDDCHSSFWTREIVEHSEFLEEQSGNSRED